MKKKRYSPAGLFLWSVSVDNWNENLWVTTRTKDICVATRKARRTVVRYARQNNKKVGNLDEIKSHGYIDA